MSEKFYKNIPYDRIPWEPTIDESICNGNGKCVEVCPADVFVLNSINSQKKRGEVQRPQNCIPLCKLCMEACPKGAISLPDRKKTEDIISKLLVQFGNDSNR